ncbi:molybdopterin-dependent oxidoreductase [Kitasatospora sp. NPDC002227]|uniref:molybdopterin-dependent oxidoreductase n=1 Tax=Kitasatospora sp. NPDC002227 TaxID=3154773 RepID=UPI00331E3D2E
MSRTVVSPAVLLHGRLAEPLELTVAHLRELPARRVDASFDCLSSGPQHHVFEGPLLWDVLRSARPLVDLAGRKQRLRHLVVVTGADGHLAVVSWAEFDPEFGAQQILLATAIDGRPLDQDGPQLVVPADVCGARHVSGVTSVRLAAAEDCD